MIAEPGALIAEFLAAIGQSQAVTPRLNISHEVLLGPHLPPALPPGAAAVYVFSLTHAYGETCPAGPHRTLKIGKADVNTGTRFRYQHYSPTSARSTLAGTLLQSPFLWPYLGISQLDVNTAGDWIKNNTDRDHFYLDRSDPVLLGQLERYLRGRLGPVFEGG